MKMNQLIDALETQGGIEMLLPTIGQALEACSDCDCREKVTDIEAMAEHLTNKAAEWQGYYKNALQALLQSPEIKARLTGPEIDSVNSVKQVNYWQQQSIKQDIIQYAAEIEKGRM